MNFSTIFSELRRRRVFRVTGIYAIVAWIVIQVAATTFPVLMLPEWTVRLVIALFLLGLPVVVALSWLFDITPAGVERTRPGETAPGEATPHSRGEPAYGAAGPIRLSRRLRTPGIVLLTLLAVATGFYHYAPHERAGGSAEVEGAAVDRSIAVLPFADFSPESDQQWFSDGLAEEILNALARLSDLRVAPRAGSFRFRDQDRDIRVIADSLGVAHILEGSVRRTDNRVRISAQLVRASDNAHLWSQSFDRDASDIILVQEEIAYEIARTLQTALDPKELARMVAVGTNSIAAYEAFLRYWHFVYRTIELEDWQLLRQAAEMLEIARAADPHFWRAHDEAAGFWIDQLKPSSRWYGITELDYPARHAKALDRVRAAEAASPDAVNRLRSERRRAQLEIRLRDVLLLSQRIVELDPSGEEWQQLGEAAVSIGEYEAAREAYGRAAQRPHELRLGLVALAAFYHRVDPYAARELISDWLAGDMNNLDQLYQAHRILLGVGQVQQAAELAERYLARSTEQTGMILVRLRQLCGEGKATEAVAYIDALPADAVDPWLRWLLEEYLGRRGAAAEALRALDDAGELYTLSTFLGYTFFDPTPFPKLSATLRRNGALRTQTLPIPYGCRDRRMP